MILGNSDGKNKGKIYLKLTGKEIITAENQDRYNAFSRWYEADWLTIKQQLTRQKIYDEDTVNETFFKIGSNILYGGLIINEFLPYFMRSCLTNFIQSSVANNRYTDCKVSVDLADTIICEYHTNRQDHRDFQEFVFAYVAKKYSKKDSYIFQTYIKNKTEKYSFRKLAELCSVSVFTVHSIVATILKDIRSNPQLASQYKDIKYQ